MTDRGSATLWVIACLALVALLTTAVTVRTLAVLARHRAEAAADFAALAAAAQVEIGDPCTAASLVAADNNAQLIECAAAANLDESEADGSEIVLVRVGVTVDLPLVGLRRITATARAEHDT